MSLQDVTLKTEYRSLRDDIAHDFYIPLLREAVIYQRAVGFFSSTVLTMITPGLYSLCENGGRVELLASPKLSADDIEAIRVGYERRYEIIENALLRELRDYDDFLACSRLSLLASLIAKGLLDIKIVEPNTDGLGMYHEKVGIIRDSEGNAVAFSGSMNESQNALVENYESFDVFCSWIDSDADRVARKELSFAALWNGLEPTVKVCDFPEVKAFLVRKYGGRPIQNEDEADAIVSDESVAESEPIATVERKFGFVLPSKITLYDYQLQAVANWRDRGYRGILDMATGTGKTFTGLAALAELSKNVARLAVIIVCPYQHLVDQWVDDIKSFGVSPIIGHSGSVQRDYKKRLSDAVYGFNLGSRDFFCFICTNASFTIKDVRKELDKLGADTALVVDEAHNFGAASLRRRLKASYQYRLALSATLERHNDEDGTRALENFFGEKCIEYGLKEAIADKKLVPYNYYPIVIYLAEDELETYYALTAEIGRNIYKQKGKIIITEQGKRLLLKRARLVAGARNKLVRLQELMQEHRSDKNMLIYCGATNIDGELEDIATDVRQIDYISEMLNLELGMRTAQFSSREDSAERKARIADFTNGRVQALVAIKCLDEGVNIPSIDKAFILASTTNPKEYIQRRGRVLRLYPGKDHADIYDFITLPRSLDTVVNTSEELAKRELALVKNEVNRMTEFSTLALNPYDTDFLINDITDAYKLGSDVAYVSETEEWEGYIYE